MIVTSPSIQSHASNQPSQSGAGIGKRAVAHEGKTNKRKGADIIAHVVVLH